MSLQGHWIQQNRPGELLLRLQIQPKASRTEIQGLHGEPARLRVRVAAPPVDGAANEELVRFLSKQLRLPQSQIEILRGATSKMKDVLLRTSAELTQIATQLLPEEVRIKP